MQHFRCILLVDDDLVSSFINQQILSVLKFSEQVHSVRNGLEALEFVEKNAAKDSPSDLFPELILLDLRMPILDGFGFLERYQELKNIRKDEIKIIVLTSSFDPQDMTRAEQYGITGYLNKPLTREGLRDVFGKTISN